MRSRSMLLLVLLVGCGDPQAFRRAQAIERQILAESPAATYADPRYVHVLRALRDVPWRSPDRARARALSQRIADGRRIAAAGAVAGSVRLPNRLQGVAEPLPLGREARSADGATPPLGRPTPNAAGANASGTAARSVADLPPEVRGKLHATLYSAAWCGYCKLAKRWFTETGIPFEERDIERDPGAAEEHRRLGRGYGGVPLIVVGETAIRGFDKRRVDQALLAMAGTLP